jgi:hypothetical protein
MRLWIESGRKLWWNENPLIPKFARTSAQVHSMHKSAIAKDKPWQGVSLGNESFLGAASLRALIIDPSFQIGRFKPSFSIREIKVVGLSPKSSAAPSTPLIFQLVLCKTTKIFSRARRRISDSVRYSGSRLGQHPAAQKKSDRLGNLSPEHRIPERHPEQR